MDNTLIEHLKKEVEKAKQKKKKIPELRKEKRLMYYSSWHKDDRPVTKQNKIEQQKKLD